MSSKKIRTILLAIFAILVITIAVLIWSNQKGLISISANMPAPSEPWIYLDKISSVCTDDDQFVSLEWTIAGVEKLENLMQLELYDGQNWQVKRSLTGQEWRKAIVQGVEKKFPQSWRLHSYSTGSDIYSNTFKLESCMDPIDWQIYNNSKYKYSIQYPLDWDKHLSNDEKYAYFLPIDNSGARFTIDCWQEKTSNIDDYEYLKDYAKNSSNKITGEYLEEKEYTLLGNPTYRVRSRRTETDGINTYFRDSENIFLINDNKLFQIGFVCAEGNEKLVDCGNYTTYQLALTTLKFEVIPSPSPTTSSPQPTATSSPSPDVVTLISTGSSLWFNMFIGFLLIFGVGYYLFRDEIWEKSKK